MESKPNNIEVIPYVEINGARTLSDHFLGDIFQRVVDDGLLSTIFGEIIFRDASDFVALMKKPANVPVFVFGGSECIGFAWLNGVGMNFAYGHFCYFKHSVYTSIDFGKAVLKYWFSLPGKNGPFLDVIIGSVPSFNQKASHYVQKLGFIKIGEIPNLYTNRHTGEKWASVIHHMQRPA